MRVLLITSDFKPKHNSAAAHMHSLYEFLYGLGLTVDICTQTRPAFSDREGNIFFSNNPFANTDNYLVRLIFELLSPILIYLKYQKIRKTQYDYVVTYSPSIFWIILLLLIKQRNKNSKKILLLRDIFPDWAIGMGIIRNSLIGRFFSLIATKLYKFHDEICVQSEYDKELLIKKGINKEKIKIVYSWYDLSAQRVEVSENTSKFGDYCVYLGNLGVAQGRDKYLDIMRRLASKCSSMNFLFIGLKSKDQEYGEEKLGHLQNVYFLPPMSGDALLTTVSRAQFGLFALDFSLLTNNVPGKSLFYTCNGIPSVGWVENNQELEKLFDENEIGFLTSEYSKLYNFISTKKYAKLDKSIILNVAFEKFSTAAAVKKIFGRLEVNDEA